MDVSRGLRFACLVWCAALMWACGGDDGDVIDLRDGSYPAEEDAGDGGARDGSVSDRMDASADAGMDGGDLDADLDGDVGDDGDAAVPTGPLVEVLSPLATDDPLTGTVLTGPSLAVRCRAQQRPGEAPVDQDQVYVSIYNVIEAPGGGSSDAGSDAGAIPEMPAVRVQVPFEANDDFRNAQVPLAGVETGRIRIRCEATNAEPIGAQTGYAEIDTYYDGGPGITFMGLTDETIVARGNNQDDDLYVKFRVTPSPITGVTGVPDPGAALSDVKLQVGDRPVTLAPPVDGVYTFPIDFLRFFPGVAVTSVSLEVIATNQRAPTPVTARKKLIVRVDGAGPLVSVTSPVDEASPGSLPFVRGTVRVRLNAMDPLAGLAGGATAKITVDQGTSTYVLVEEAPGVLGFTFESTSFEDRALLVAQISVFDKVGNVTAVSHTMRVDNVAPWISLDPPTVRVTAENSDTCSGPFDPLGVTPIDGEVVQQQARIRALVWERATIRPGATETFISGVDDGSVMLVSQPYGPATDPENSEALLIDRDGDGFCDDVNDPTTPGQFRVPLAPITPGGAAPAETGSLSSDPAAGGVCSMPLMSMAMPVCSGNDMTSVVGHIAVGRAPVVYGYAPTGGPPACTGASLDLSSAGWHCVTTIARDRSGDEGNLGIAPPIRVCRKIAPTDCGGAIPGAILTPPADLTCRRDCMLPPVWSAPAMPRILLQ